jgi:hypothetical protein
MRLSEMRKPTNTKKINKVMESRFGFKIDYDNMTLEKAVSLAKGITEGLETIKKSHGVHVAEKNSKYMEMFMVREGLHSWMMENQRRFVMESEMAKSEAILAAKDMVDSVQDMLTKLSKMQNEELPALLDTIADQIGTAQSESFKAAVQPMFQSLYDALAQGRETASNAARGLTGEGQPADAMSMGGDDGMGGMDDAMGVDPMGGDNAGGDGFDATDAAVGGEDELGREKRDEVAESRMYARARKSRVN